MVQMLRGTEVQYGPARRLRQSDKLETATMRAAVAGLPNRAACKILPELRWKVS